MEDHDQLHFGDLPQRSRPTDPRTAREAGKQLSPVTVNTRCSRYLVVVAEAGRKGATRDEIASAVGAQGAEDRALSRRLTDLRQAGLVKDSGRTRTSESCREQIVWTCTDRGHMEAARVIAAETREAS